MGELGSTGWGRNGESGNQGPKTARPELGCLLLLVAMLALGISHVEAAYRLTFQNGTSVEVQSYEDLGDAIRYPRLGGVVVVPKSSISAVEEAVHLPPPTQPAPASRAPSTTFPTVIPGVPEASRPNANPPAGSSPAVPRPAPVRSTPVLPTNPFSMISGVLNILGGFIIFMIAASGVLFWFRVSGKYARKERTFPYEKARSLLTPAERSFYGVLCQALALFRNSASRQDAKIAKTDAHNMGQKALGITAPGGVHQGWPMS